MNNRLKQLRKTLDLTQKQFADQIGTRQNVIANYERGIRKPSASVVNNICKTFGVSETWLRTGTPPMFLPRSPQSDLDDFLDQHNCTETERIMIRHFMDLSPEVKHALIDYMRSVVEALGDNN